jgi:hypothetical protein
VIELDKNDSRRPKVVVSRIGDDGGLETALEGDAPAWGRFLRFDYLRFDFSSVSRPGMYVVSFGDSRSEALRIAADVYARGVWQPTLEYFLPIQMCHVRVNDRYRVWHDACHLDDARMAPVDHNHFDGYRQGASTLTSFEPGQPVPGLDRGGWHDAGEDDLRIESQAGTVHGLALAFEAFGVDHDNVTIDQQHRVVELHRPDGKPDVLQQIEHGLLTIVGGYRALGRFYRGIITPTLRQYVQVGDFAVQSDNVVFDPATASAEPPPVGLQRRASCAGTTTISQPSACRSRRRSGRPSASRTPQRHAGLVPVATRGSASPWSCCSPRGIGATRTSSLPSVTRTSSRSARSAGSSGARWGRSARRS